MVNMMQSGELTQLLEKEGLIPPESGAKDGEKKA
jgi:hypothetical protein